MFCLRGDRILTEESWNGGKGKQGSEEVIEVGNRSVVRWRSREVVREGGRVAGEGPVRDVTWTNDQWRGALNPLIRGLGGAAAAAAVIVVVIAVVVDPVDNTVVRNYILFILLLVLQVSLLLMQLSMLNLCLCFCFSVTAAAVTAAAAAAAVAS